MECSVSRRPPMTGHPRLVSVELGPIGRRAELPAGGTILAAAHSVGVELASACGGQGTCGHCRVRVVQGAVSAPSEQERAQLSEAELSGDVRLACQTAVASDVRIDIPTESLTTAQRLQLEGPARVALHRPADEIIAVAATDRPLLGLAVDLGTTKLAAYLVDLETGETLARTGAMNPQIAHGEDVVNRIAYANAGPAARQTLQALVVEAINRLTDELCVETDRRPEEIVDCVVVGNTAMHHLFAGLPVRQLGQAPYVAACSGALEIRAAEVGMRLARGATLYIPPLIAGYVGADHVAMLLATGTAQATGTVLALDIGTNTEISLACGGRLWSCSTASGPAFEGAHISSGMRAAPGAIERVHYHDGRFLVQTVDDRPPVGLCGSGILDAVAQGLEAGIIDGHGAMLRSHPLVQRGNGRAVCLLVPAAETGHHRDIVFTREDVGEIQLAKGAIKAGTDLLLAAAGIEVSDLEEVIVAGAFGTYLDVRSAIRVGLLPAVPEARCRQVGNAAGAGARRLLLSRRARDAAAEVALRVEYLELTTHPAFADHFAEAVSF